MELQQIKYILAIAEKKNITKAAEKMFISQSAMSQHLLKVEQELGTPLFVRNGRSLEITDAGRIYVNTAEAILNVEKSFLHEEEEYGKNMPKVRIAVSTEVPAFVADKLITAIRKKRDFGNATVFYAHSEDGRNLQRLLVENMADIVIEACEKERDSGMETLAQEVESFCFFYCGEPSPASLIDVWLSPAMWKRRLLEEDALRNAGITVSLLGTCELPLQEMAQKTSSGMFLAKSQMKNVRGKKPRAEFIQQFTARCIKKNE